MKNYSDHLILFISLAIFSLLWITLHPYLGYILDSDCVAYLTIANRVARQQYFESINGLWSPLNSWLLVPFIKNGIDAWLSAKALNCFLGGVVIVLSHLLFIRFKLNKLAHICLLVSLSIVMVHNVYWQMFGDVLQIVFVLIYLLILWSNQFTNSYFKPILCGVIMGFGFYAKAYTLLFFFIHFAITLYWFYKHNKIDSKRAIIMYCIGIFSALLVTFPWTFALHKKYDEWTLTGFAGKLNMSWYINSGKSFRSDIKLLIPPTYINSPSFWEDPYVSQENLSSPTTSTKHFVKWIVRVVHTSIVSLNCFIEISFLALAILFISFYYFFFRKEILLNANDKFYIQLLVISIIILPIGYLMMHIETRYIWLNIILLMLLAAILLNQCKQVISKMFYAISIGIISLSFMLFPIMNIQNSKYKNKELFDYAKEFLSNNIKGSFTSNAVDAGRMWVLAYLSHTSFYTIERTDYSADELISEMKRYKVKYYLLQTENNKMNITLDSANFKFVFKANDFDLYELKNSQ